MEKKENLTNEKLRNKFANQFELVSYAIKLAENMIRTGRAPRVKTETQNASLNVLAEIASGKDVLEELPVETLVVNEKEIVDLLAGKEGVASTKTMERKKSRIVSL
jgi:hypothetical protein